MLASVPPLRGVPLRVPVTYERDGLFLTVLTKAIAEDGLWHTNRFGVPFGADLVDWPLGIWLPFAQLAALTRLLGEPGHGAQRLLDVGGRPRRAAARRTRCAGCASEPVWRSCWEPSTPSSRTPSTATSST